jgi:ribonuclease D
MNVLELATIEEVINYFEDLADNKINAIAIDIECEMNLHCYGEHLCLIQIYDKKNNVIIDPFKFKDKNDLNHMLKMVFESRNILKLTYDVAGDTSLIEKLHGVKYKSVFDLRPAVQLLDYEKQSLTNILNEELSIPLIQKKKFQTYNWMKRPIDPEALEYAISDVIYLFDLKDKLMDKIISRGLMDKYMLQNLMAQNKDYVEPKPEDIYKRRKGYSKLPRWAKNRYKVFYDLREKYAEKLNKSPNFLISNLDLLPLAIKKVEVNSFLAKSLSYRISKEDRNDLVQEMLKIYFEK